MPTISISRRALENLVNKKFSEEELKNKINDLGVKLEAINKDELTLEVNPDRPDLLSVQGISRALSSLIGKNTGLKKYTIKKSGEKVFIENSVKNIRPYTACAIVKNLKFNEENIKEVIEIQEKLHITFGRNRKKIAIGIYPYERIKTPITFFAADPKTIKFRPLEFPREITGLQVLSQHPAGRKYAHLLEGKDKFPFFKDSNNRILSMPPIINSNDTGKITEKTRDVFIECSGFDFSILNKCLSMIVTALADIGGEIYSVEFNYGNKKIITPNLEPGKMKLDINYANKILGLKINENKAKKLLNRMGFDYKNKQALIPAYRADILHQIDLVEDIAKAYGYDNFREEIPKVATIAEEDQLEVFKARISEILIGLGLLEVNTLHLVPEDANKKINLDVKNIKIENAKSGEYSTLRGYMLPSLLIVLQNNKNREYPQNIFEIGTVFKQDFSEKSKLCITLCGGKANFSAIKQVSDYLFSLLNLEYKTEEADLGAFISGRSGRILVKNRKIGSIGEISPQTLGNFELEMPVSAIELDMKELYKTLKE